jgi:hypothetical protein
MKVKKEISMEQRAIESKKRTTLWDATKPRVIKAKKATANAKEAEVM